MPPQYLRIPGPTPLPDAVREAGSEQMVGHRGPEFMELVKRCSEGMNPYFRTASDVMILTSSGTGGLEAAVVTFLSPGDTVLTVSIGNFGERFAQIARAYGAEVTMLEFDWGQAADAEAVRAAIGEMVAAGRAPVAVQVTYNETSTGVTNPLPSLAEAHPRRSTGHAHPRRWRERGRSHPHGDGSRGISTSSSPAPRRPG